MSDWLVFHSHHSQGPALAQAGRLSGISGKRQAVGCVVQRIQRNEPAVMQHVQREGRCRWPDSTPCNIELVEPSNCSTPVTNSNTDLGEALVTAALQARQRGLNQPPRPAADPAATRATHATCT